MPIRTAVNIIVLLVLALRSLLPAGYMVQASDATAGSFEIVICTGSGTQLMTVGEDGTPLPASKSQHLEKGLCAFAAAGAVALNSEAPHSLASEVEFAAVSYTLAAALFAETPKPGATSARGPPSELI